MEKYIKPLLEEIVFSLEEGFATSLNDYEKDDSLDWD